MGNTCSVVDPLSNDYSELFSNTAPVLKMTYCKYAPFRSHRRIANKTTEERQKEIRSITLDLSNYERACRWESDDLMEDFFSRHPQEHLPSHRRNFRRFVTTRKLLVSIAAGNVLEFKILVVRRNGVYYIIDPSETGPTKLEIALNGLYAENPEDTDVRRAIFYAKFRANHVVYFSTIELEDEQGQFTSLEKEIGREANNTEDKKAFLRTKGLNAFWKMHLGNCNRIIRTVDSGNNQPLIDLRDQTIDEFENECRKECIEQLREEGQKKIRQFFENVASKFRLFGDGKKAFQHLPGSVLNEVTREMETDLTRYEQIVIFQPSHHRYPI